MTHRRWLGLAVAGAAVASVLTVGASALAASAPTAAHRNNRAASTRVATRSGPSVLQHRAGTVTHHYSLAASAFAPDSTGNTADDYYNSWDPAALRDASSERCFNAGLSLPWNATIKTITVFYTEGGTSMYVELNRQNLLTHNDARLTNFNTATTTGTPFYTRTAKNISSDGAVNYSAYGYGVGVCPHGTTTFSGVIIAYTQPS